MRPDDVATISARDHQCDVSGTRRRSFKLRFGGWLQPRMLHVWCCLLVISVFVLGDVRRDFYVRADETSKDKTALSKTKKVDKPAEPASDANKKTGKESVAEADSERPPKVVKTNAEWRKILPALSFRVARLKETETAFSNKYWNNKKDGKYVCICCGEELYRSDEKFDSGTGWPSFWAPISEHAIATEIDYANNSVRTEVHCDRCAAHLGHIFEDGPQPTGMRHCINSASLKFVPADGSKTK